MDAGHRGRTFLECPKAKAQECPEAVVGPDTMCTYVAGKRCAVVTKREIAVPNGRFSVDPDGLLLFGSATGGAAANVAIKFVKFIADTARQPRPGMRVGCKRHTQGHTYGILEGIFGGACRRS